MDPILVAESVRKLHGDVVALRGVDLRIDAGEHLAVVGPAASGKTTLLRCLSGLDPVDGGTLCVEGTAMHRLRDVQRTSLRGRRMGFVVARPALIPVLTAAENVELPLLLDGVAPAPARARAVAALDEAGLAGAASRHPGALSPEERLRVAVARGIVTRPAVVWADEPTAGLDPAAAAGILDLLRAVHAAGQAVVLVTRDPGIGHRAPRVVTLIDGEVVADRPGRLQTPAAA